MNEEKGKSKTQPKSKEEQGPRISINNTLYLNTSSNYQSLNIDNANMNPSNTSFDMKKTSTSVYQPSSKVDDSKRKKEENNKNNTSFQQQNSSFVNESRMEKTFSNTICCQHEDELKKAKQKLDHLTKKMKLITEENKVLIL